MKRKNAIIGTKVKVKVCGVHSGCTGIIVDYTCHDRPSILVQLDTDMSPKVHAGNGITKSGKEFPNSWYYDVAELKRIKE